jgi:hypothetical protein
MFDSEQTPWRRRIIIFSGIQAFLGVPPPRGRMPATPGPAAVIPSRAFLF